MSGESSKKSALVPKLRFPEFRRDEAWKPTTLGKEASILKGKGISKADLDPKGAQPCIRYGELYTRYGETIKEAVSHTAVPPSELFLSKRDDVIIPSSGETKIDIAKASCVLADNIALGGDLNVIRSKLNGTFLSYYLNGPKKFDIAKVAQGDTVVHLYPHQLEALRIAFPSPAEQHRIAECLSSLDALITAEIQKLEALKTHKKGLMQQLFPRPERIENGIKVPAETQPRLRFPEFQKAGEWEVKRLDAVAPLQRGFDLPSDEILPGKVPIVYSNGPKGFHERGMAKGPGLVTGRSGTIGKLHFIDSGDYWPHNTSLWVTSFKGHSPKFVYYLYESIGFLRFASGSGVPTLNRNDAHSFEASVPPTLPEQHRIAECLSSLDALITAEIQKLEALKTHKKGLMQQLFPSPEEVEA
jgi:type I restriction enzyme S subunit